MISILLKKVSIIQDEIIRIIDNTLYGKGKYRFNTLISTIPLPRLYELYGVHKTFNYRAIGYAFSTIDESFFFAMTFDDYDYVYFPEMIYPYYRVTKISEGFVYEFIYNPLIKYPRKIIWQDFGKILPPFRVKPPTENVITLGRFSEWDDNILYQDVLKKVYSLREVAQDVQGVQG